MSPPSRTSASRSASTFDDRGRMWAIQYLQYPNPAGLKPVAGGPVPRAPIYDRVPEPPPKGPRGADRITILEDTDGDGRCRQVEGLRRRAEPRHRHGVRPRRRLRAPGRRTCCSTPTATATTCPTATPRCCSTGFGMEDAHVARQLTHLGPGRLALRRARAAPSRPRIRGIEFQQGVWRYHPLDEASSSCSAEGGGNTWGLDFDRHGNLLRRHQRRRPRAATHVQGAYYCKGFGKHGPLHNPYAFGYFDHVAHAGLPAGTSRARRLDLPGRRAARDASDGSASPPTCWPTAIDWHAGPRRRLDVHDASSTATSLGVDRPVVPAGRRPHRARRRGLRRRLVRPADQPRRPRRQLGPGATAASSASARRGRRRPAPFDLAKRSGDELVDLLGHPNGWYARTARRILAERRDPAVDPGPASAWSGENDGRARAAGAVGAVRQRRARRRRLAADLLDHRTPDVRALDRPAARRREAGRRRRCTTRWSSWPQSDPSPVVRSQLACTARRLPAATRLPILERTARAATRTPATRTSRCCSGGRSRTGVRVARGWGRGRRGLFDAPAAWKAAIVRKTLLERVARRLTAEPTAPHLESCASCWRPRRRGRMPIRC